MKDKLDLCVEALIFASAHPIGIREMQRALWENKAVQYEENEISESIEKLEAKYASEDYSFRIFHVGNGYRFMTKDAFHALVVTQLKNESRKRLTRAAIETLSIIAYKQPVTRTEVENIRGVNSEYSIQKLLEKDLVEIIGRDPGPGRPLIYKTTDYFMDYFGLSSMDELPNIKDIHDEKNEIGEHAPVEEKPEEEGKLN